MASVSHIQLTVIWLQPGASDTINWNNAPWNRVYALSASPVAHQNGAVAKMEITRIWEQHHFDTGETEVWFTVKNIGSFGGYCYIFMSQVAP
jgi:hypothetical protein